MIIKTKLSEQDYINVSFVLLYRKTYIRVIYAVFIICILTSALAGNFLKQDLYSDIIFPAAALLILPAFTYLGAKKNYASNARIKETIEYKFEKDNLVIEGESFKSQLSWSNIYKVTQTKNWVLIWQNRQIANVIPKTDIWEGEREELKTIITQYHVKNNL